jgi:hypothetical protein
MPSLMVRNSAVMLPSSSTAAAAVRKSMCSILHTLTPVGKSPLLPTSVSKIPTELAASFTHLFQ